MRIIIYGIGAIGGAIAVRLALTGHDVVAIARGRQLAAVRETGLALHTPEGIETARFAVHSDPSEVDFQPDDVILMTMKSQDSPAALERLAETGVFDQAVFCFQNGVANERMAQRYFPNVYGVTVMMPAVYQVAGAVAAFGTPKRGLFDIGRYPRGIDDVTIGLCDILNAAGFVASSSDEVMQSKYRKLLANLRNATGAALTDEETDAKWYVRARAEAETVLRAAGIAWEDGESLDRKELMQEGAVAGVDRIGSSSLQSLKRAAGSIETDYLNGEIALLGRLHGIQTPVNTAICRLSRRMAAGAIVPQSLTDADIEREVATSG
ncbi:2-dehydropantoate 2-reductase N-terminal domain-containing protein [uncultured Martelella sp.]|uniref:ketopantoate reductase family protein n=1 Tax=uncultured Martelella sp. TaxID=392331 RepID=UPI0029C89EEC|nr:2-dehydropantoate 2-reductase N-terminal domain-containing protein [uncultured Martelella sp.]